MRSLRRSCIVMLALLLFLSQTHAASPGPGVGREAGAHGAIGETLPLWSTLPFAGILLSIAIFPLVAPRFWHHRYHLISLAWAVMFAVPFLWNYRTQALQEIAHIYLLDYIPFIVLLWGLFTASGGIVVTGSLVGTPRVNTAILAAGTLIASWIGTTGAAMLLIRPLLRANARRKRKTHVVVFFIFLVANIGGSLTPLGDPPLFLGFLHSVPFFWTLHLFPMMLLVSVLLLVLFWLIDSFLYRREVRVAPPPGGADREDPIRVRGLYNLAILGGIMGAVLLSGSWKPGEIDLWGIHLGIQNITRDLLILVLGMMSLRFTPARLRAANEFSWAPIREVAYLFAGIFMTIIPALEILKAGERGHLAFLVQSIREPWHYFWVTGGLSSFLDNAPTYLTFLNSALGQLYPGQPESASVARLIAENEVYLLAISAGAVFMGALTYIGNAPNFMVRSIAEEAGLRMPSFFGYMMRWALPILVPIFLVLTLIFF
jgi:Na+/H+ antiporter NhaD/arsenite permease-like protein